MGIIKSINEWETGLGEAAGDYIQNSLTEVTGFLCDVRAKYPNSFFDRSFGRGVANSICSKIDKPIIQEPERAYDGGQCEGVQYEVLVEADRFAPGSTINQAASSRLVVFGPIDSIFAGRDSPVNDPRVLALQCFAHDVNGNPAYFGDVYGGTGWTAEITSIVINRTDGLPDECGDIVATPEPDPPREPADFNRTYDIDVFDNSGNVIDTQNILITLDDKDTYNLPISFTVGDTIINVGIDGFSTPDPDAVDETDDDDDGGTSTPDGEVPTVTCAPPPPPSELEPEPQPETEEEEKEEENIEYVAVDITRVPPYGKTVLQSREANNDYFAGYFIWTIGTPEGSYDMPQIPIRKKRQIFQNPGNANGYRMYAVNGARLKATTYKLPVGEPT